MSEDIEPDTTSGRYYSTSLKRWKIQNLDYNFYWGFTVLLGWFGVDYWYLGAPLTGLLKLIVNIFTFGYWWFYDVLNATFNRPTIELFGPIMPIFGTLGCAGARFRQKDGAGPQSKLDKHLNYMLYGLVLGFGGMFGADSYLIGHKYCTYFRLICWATIIGIPIALLWWLINMYEYVFNPNYFIDSKWQFLGASPPDGDPCPSIFTRIMSSVASLFSFTLPVPDEIGQVQAALLKEENLNLSQVQKLAGPTFPPVGKPAFPSFIGGGEPTLSNTNTHLLSLLFAGTIGFIVVSSIILSLRRSYQNGNKKSVSSENEQRGHQENDDVPPQPRVPRVTPKDA